MAFNHHFVFLFSSLLFLSTFVFPSAGDGTARMLYLVQEKTVLTYHHGPLLKGNMVVNIAWYGQFTAAQRAIVIDFIQSVGTHIPAPSVNSWWSMTEKYLGGTANLLLGTQTFDDKYSLGKSLKPNMVARIARRGNHTTGSITVVLTAKDVFVTDFCMSSCGYHSSGMADRQTKTKFPFIWVGNSETQCPGECAWPYAQPTYGPQTKALVSPNGDVGIDGMVINLATLLADTVTNPYDSGYYQGAATAPLEAVSACTGLYGKGAYQGYAGELLVDKTTGSSYNAVGIHGRKYLLPAMWNPKTSACTTLV